MILDSFLKHCGEIVQKDAASGQKYNIFKVLGDYRKELMHSAILASFLDPRGAHGQGAVFLRHFIAELNIKNFKPEEAFVVCEKAIGDVIKTDNGFVGGRIDICIQDSYGRQIFIENKIDATDQYRQLERYHKYDGKAIILYLTLDGHRPSSESDGGDNSFYTCISYKQHILNWLNRCIEDNTNNKETRKTIPEYLKDILRNYRNLLTEDFCKQDMTNTDMNSLLAEIEKNKETVDTAFEIANSIIPIKIRAQKSLWEKFKNQLPRDLNPTFFSLNGVVDDNGIDKLIENYYSNSNNSSKYYGVAVGLGSISGKGQVYLALLVNINLNICIVADSAESKKQLLQMPYFKEAINPKGRTDRDWFKSDLPTVVAYRYPSGNRLNLQAFDNPLIRELTYNKENPEITKILSEDFQTILKQTKAGLKFT